MQPSFYYFLLCFLFPVGSTSSSSSVILYVFLFLLLPRPFDLFQSFVNNFLSTLTLYFAFFLQNDIVSGLTSFLCLNLASTIFYFVIDPLTMEANDIPLSAIDPSLLNWSVFLRAIEVTHTKDNSSSHRILRTFVLANDQVAVIWLFLFCYDC